MFPIISRGGKMVKKISWLALGLVTILAMVLVSCGKAPPAVSQTVVTGTAYQPSSNAPSATTTASTIANTTVKTTTAATTTAASTTASNTPKYGGTFVGVFQQASSGFDSFYRPSTAYTTILTNEGMAVVDWAKGPSGSNETDMAWSSDNPRLTVGCLATSWDIPDPNTVIFHIRQGVHWALNTNFEASRLVGGRELVADDVAKEFTRILTNPASTNGGSYYKWFKSATATDKYTVTLKCDDESNVRTSVAMNIILKGLKINPPEVIAKWGNMSDWKNSVGTGPFMLTDYVSGSSYTMVKNPNYWGTDPVGPGKGNKLPYLDGITYLDVYDTSTRLAALRTGKVDVMINVSWEDGNSLLKTNTELKSKKLLANTIFLIHFKVDKPEIPLYDIKVRQALLMAVNRKELADTYYGGAPEINCYPVSNTPEFNAAFTPPDKLPDAAKMTFEYNVDKAKALLAQTKWPTGFKTSIITASYPAWVDQLSLLKNYWSKIGVDLTINSMEYAPYLSIYSSLKAPEMVVGTSMAIGVPYRMYFCVVGDDTNNSGIDDKYLQNNRNDMWSFINITNQAKKDQLLKDSAAYWLGLAPGIAMPLPYTYTMWQPWVHNYNGEYYLGAGNANLFVEYMWIDQSLKQQMMGRK
jgi:peptide/nickel transport system substrate-binding protein